MKIGVAIVTYNSAQDIVTCIESVVREGVREISIVDSASEDATVQELSRLGYPVEVLDSNKGFGYASNRSTKKMNTEYVLFLNPDSTLKIGAISNVMRTIQEHPNAGIVGMLLCDPSGIPEKMAYGDEPSLFQMVFRRLYYKKPSSSPFPVGWVSGGALLIRKELFEEVGGFDEEFFLYWEDIDLCKRVRQKGYTVLMDPTAQVTHVRGGSNLSMDEKTRIYDQSADRYFKKHYSTTIWKIQRFLRRLYRL
jgi:GT2 family glycosyltransferase